MKYTKALFCALTSLHLLSFASPITAQSAVRDDSVFEEDDGNYAVYSWVFEDTIPEIGGKRKLLSCIDGLLDPYLYKDWETCGSIGLFLSMGEREAAAIVSKGINDGIVNPASAADCASIEYIRQSLNYIDTANELRARHGKKPLKVDASMMAAAIIQGDRSAQTLDHSRLYAVGENLAWGQQISAPMSENEINPFDWWYTKEKDIFAQTPDAYEAAHYRNLLKDDYAITGFALGSCCPLYTTVFDQTFKTKDAAYPGMSTAQFRAAIDTFQQHKTLGSYEPDAQGGLLMYRMYNKNSGEHFYTADRQERNGLRVLGWTYEGIGWIASVSGSPVWRLYNENAGDHHYTTDEREREALIRAGWKDEGIGWYSSGSRPLYRQYNPNAKSGSHNFTSSEAERDFLLSAGWRDESIAWYGLQGD